MKYRMYIDENGNSDMNATKESNHRYLGLAGIVLGLDHVADLLFPRLEAFKRDYFGSHPDDPTAVREIAG